MDTSANYRHILKETLLQYAAIRPSHGDIRVEPIFDDENGRYALMQIGWDLGRRVSGDLFYASVRGDKVYIEYDGIGYGITDDLIANGISESDIVLAFLPDQPVAVAI